MDENSRTILKAARAAQSASSKIGRSVELASKTDASDGPPAAVTALISWAHRGEGWSETDAADWTRSVVKFTGALRQNGIDADLDLFHAHEPDIDWTRFGPRAVESADFVLVVMSEAWGQRWMGTNSPTVGAGAVAEADALKGLFQKNQSEWQRKISIVMLPSQDESSIPADLMRVTRFSVDPDSPDSLETLLRTLTSQPLYTKPALGSVPILPAAVAASLRAGAQIGAETTEFQDYSALLEEVAKISSAQKLTDRTALLKGLLDALSQ